MTLLHLAQIAEQLAAEITATRIRFNAMESAHPGWHGKHPPVAAALGKIHWAQMEAQRVVGEEFARLSLAGEEDAPPIMIRARGVKSAIDRLIELSKEH